MQVGSRLSEWIPTKWEKSGNCDMHENHDCQPTESHSFIFSIVAGYHTVESVRRSNSLFFFVFLVHIHSYSTFLLFIKQQIAHATVRKLSEVKGISEAKVLKLKELVKTLVPMEFMSVRLLDCLGCLSFCCSFS